MSPDLYIVVVMDSMVRTNVRAYGPLSEEEARDLASELNSGAGDTGPGTVAAVQLLPVSALVREGD